ncbi:MAG: sulfatase family protein [Acidobacteriota bacterium]
MQPLFKSLITVGIFLCAAIGLLALGFVSPQAEQTRPPSILLAIADDWSYGHAGVYGTKWVNTPAFDRIAREGVLLENAFTSNPKCSPCRASLLTGRNSWQLEEATNHFGIFPAKWPVYQDILEKAGYLVGFTGKGWGPGDFKAGGFERNPAGPEYSGNQLTTPHAGMSNKDYAANFVDFLKERQPGQPFSFWFGTHEPHRVYEQGIGLRSGKRLEDVDLPAYYPDSNLIRSDILDYAVEVEWFDTHLGRIIEHLEKIGQLENTLILVTSDHGMPFPRVKGQVYEHGYRLPLAVRWGSQVKPGRKVEDFINVRDFAPTFLEAAGLAPPDSMTGRSFLGLLKSDQSGWIDSSRNRMVIGKERHDLGRPHDWGYPVRALRTPEYLYIRNYHPERWPAGNPETSYPNCDNSPTKTFLTFRFDEYYRLAFGKRPAEELYRISEDPDCVDNLANDPQLAEVKEKLREEMEALLRADQDPRVLGNEEIFDTYQYVGGRRHAYDAWLEHSGAAP